MLYISIKLIDKGTEETEEGAEEELSYENLIGVSCLSYF